MREINNYELETYYGGAILTTITAVIGIAIMAIAAYKLITSDSAKVKLPGGTDISFSGPKNKEVKSRTRRSTRPKPTTAAKTHTH